MAENCKYSQRKRILSWSKQCLNKSRLIGEDKFISIVVKNDVKSYLYHPSMELVQNLIQTEEDSKAGTLCISDLYKLDVFEDQCIFLPQLRENKDKRDTWYRYRITDVSKTKREDGITPLSLACYYGKPQVVLLLLSVLEHPVDVESADGSTPLIETIGAFEDDEEERIECIQHLVKYGATAHNNREGGHNALTLSCYIGKEVIVKLLDSTFPGLLDWNHQTSIGHTPLMFAIYSGKFDLIKYLINVKKVDILVANSSFLTAFDICLLLDSEPKVKGLLAMYMQHGKKLKEYIENKIEVLYDAVHNPRCGNILTVCQRETMFVSCLLSVVYLGRFKPVRNVILESGVLDFITTYKLWESAPHEIKTEFWLVLATYLFYDDDREGMAKLLFTDWAAKQFQYEDDHLDQATEFSLDRFMGIISFFLCADGGHLWIIKKFKEHPKLGLRIANFDPAHDTFVNGFFNEVSKILEEFNIEDGFCHYSRNKIKSKKLLEDEAQLKQRIEKLVPMRNNVLKQLQKSVKELENLAMKKKRIKTNRRGNHAKKEIEISFIIERKKNRKDEMDYNINAKGDCGTTVTMMLKKPNPEIPIPLIDIDQYETLTKKQLRKVKKENKKRHLHNLQMAEPDVIIKDAADCAKLETVERKVLETSASDTTIKTSRDDAGQLEKNKSVSGDRIDVIPTVTKPDTKKNKKEKRAAQFLEGGHGQTTKGRQRRRKKEAPAIEVPKVKESAPSRNLKIVGAVTLCKNKKSNPQKEPAQPKRKQSDRVCDVVESCLDAKEGHHKTKGKPNNARKTDGGFGTVSEFHHKEKFNKTSKAPPVDKDFNVEQPNGMAAYQDNIPAEENLESNRKGENKNPWFRKQTEKKNCKVYQAEVRQKQPSNNTEELAQTENKNNLEASQHGEALNGENSDKKFNCSNKPGMHRVQVEDIPEDNGQCPYENNDSDDFMEFKTPSQPPMENKPHMVHTSSGYYWSNNNPNHATPLINGCSYWAQPVGMPIPYVSTQLPYNHMCEPQDQPLHPPPIFPNIFDPAIVSIARPHNQQAGGYVPPMQQEHKSKAESPQQHFPSAAHEPIPLMLKDIISNAESNNSHSKLNRDRKIPYNSQPVNKEKTKNKSTESESGYITPPNDQEEKSHVVQQMFVKNWQCRSLRWKGMLLNLVQSPPAAITKVGSLNFLNNDQVISKGSCGTVVRVGIRDDGSEVAVKCMVKAYTSLIYNELQSLRELHHPNIIQYKDYVEDSNFAYVALELCEYTLDEYVSYLVKKGLLENHTRKLCMQIMTGLKTLHDAKVLHMDLKPRNVLVDVKGNIRLADFGLSHRLNEEQTTFYHTSVHGTKCWRAPETIGVPYGPGANRGRYKPSTDIYVAGMILYFIKTGGKHPFGEDSARCEVNILNGCSPELWAVQDEVFVDLFVPMMDPDMNRRASIDECLRHPFFWDDRRRFEFLVCVGHDHEVAARISNDFIKTIETCLMMQASTQKWTCRMNKDFLAYMGWSRLNLNSVLDILTIVIPEIDERWHHIERDMRGILGVDADTYILSCFSGLFMAVYDTVRKIGWQRRHGLREFFSNHDITK